MVTDGEQQVECSVCGEAVERGMTAECNWCDQIFHLNQRNDVEGKDCGEVWIDERYLALQFACAKCLSDGDEAPRKAASVTSKEEPTGTSAHQRRYKRRA